jgi:Ser/Thr protein kinase RdoA (MazF antagonist)
MTDPTFIEPPPEEVLEHFDLALGQHLGGSRNKHWVARSRGQPVVLRRYGEPVPADVGYELRVVQELANRGWPVPEPIGDPIVLNGVTWVVMRWLRGNALPEPGEPAEQRSRGRLLARLHLHAAELTPLGQRSGWLRADELVTDPELDGVLRAYESYYPEDARLLRWHLDHARQAFADLEVGTARQLVLHGDFTPWNLHYDRGELSGILDFDFTHLDFLVADFALSWRGRYDDVVSGYQEITPLDPIDLALITPVYWAWMFIGVRTAIEGMIRGEVEPSRLAWSVEHLKRRSSLMAGYPTSPDR